VLRKGAEIAFTHHEKYNGSGYPSGTRGDAIPLAGRITALADVFDALTSDRPYKKAWTMDESLDQIKSDSGTHFDPKVVDAFLTVLPEVNKIKAHYSGLKVA
jgi:putative two-component system response regulator